MGWIFLVKMQVELWHKGRVYYCAATPGRGIVYPGRYPDNSGRTGRILETLQCKTKIKNKKTKKKVYVCVYIYMQQLMISQFNFDVSIIKTLCTRPLHDYFAEDKITA